MGETPPVDAVVWGRLSVHEVRERGEGGEGGGREDGEGGGRAREEEDGEEG